MNLWYNTSTPSANSRHLQHHWFEK